VRIPGYGGTSAADVAVACYEKWKQKAEARGEVTVPFAVDLADYMRNGLVIARPDIFGMARVIDWEGQPAWFVRIAVGDLRTLIAEIPAHLPRICFCRRGDPRIHAWSLERLIELVRNHGLHG